MGILKRLLSGASPQPDYSAPHVLRTIWDRYCEKWPGHNERYRCWKPVSILPAPKWAVKRAVKLGYAEWPEPICWSVFHAFFMEFVDLALHLPQEQYDMIEKFGQRRVLSGGKENVGDPLLWFFPHTALVVACTIEESNQSIVNVRDELRRSVVWDPVGVNDDELDAVRRIVLESTVEVAALIQEWRFYILSIGRDQYIQDP